MNRAFVTNYATLPRREEEHHHGHDHEEASELSETELRVRAIQTILVEKGYTDAAALDAIVEAQLQTEQP